MQVKEERPAATYTLTLNEEEMVRLAQMLCSYEPSGAAPSLWSDLPSAVKNMAF